MAPRSATAFNTRPLRARAAIVAAGPLANLLLAVLLYAAVNWSGVDEPKAMLSSPVAGSIAQRAGVQGGEQVVSAAIGEDELEPVRSFEELRWVLTRGALDAENVRLLLQPVRGAQREVVLPLAGMQVREADAQLFRSIGIVGPWTRPVLGEVMAGGAAERAGLHPGDWWCAWAAPTWWTAPSCATSYAAPCGTASRSPRSGAWTARGACST